MCKDCPGRFADEIGLKQCKSCPLGTWMRDVDIAIPSTAIQSRSAASVRLGAARNQRPSARQFPHGFVGAACELCAQGTYHPYGAPYGNSNWQQIGDPLTMISWRSASENSWGCTDCPPDWYADAGSDKLSDCYEGLRRPSQVRDWRVAWHIHGFWSAMQ